jgi:hypothetical protein
MNRRALCALAIWAMLSGSSAASFAQSLSDSLVGTWQINVEDGNPPRRFEVRAVGQPQGDSAGLDAQWGYWDQKGRSVRATVQVGEPARIQVTTPTNSLVSATLDAGSLTGTFRTPAGKEWKLTGTRTVAQTSAAATAAGLTAAPEFMSAPEMKQLAEDKVWTFRRARDQQNVKWDIRKNGFLYGDNLSSGQRDTAKWKVTDRGELCVEWRGNSTNACVSVRRNAAGQLQMFESKAPTQVFADLATN